MRRTVRPSPFTALPRRRRARLVCAVLAVPLLLFTAACGGGSGQDGSGSSGAVPAVTAGASFGQKPTIAVGSGKAPAKLAVRVLKQGSGSVVNKDDVVSVNYLGQLWDSSQPFDNSYDRGEPFTTQIGTGQVIKGWDEALVGQRVGSRVEVVAPPSLAYGAQGSPPSIPGNSTLVFVIDVLKSVSTSGSAKGVVRPQSDGALPRIGTNTDGKAPSVVVPKGAAPRSLVSDYVIEGTGRALKSTDTAIIQYQEVLWDGGKLLDSTYERGQALPAPLDQLNLKGLAEGLTGMRVGSRVLVVVPPSLGYGGKGNPPTIPGNATLVFSVDVLGTL